MAPTAQDPEDVLDLLGVEEQPADVSPPRVARPPTNPGGPEGDLRAKLEQALKVKDRLEQEKARLEKQVKTAQDSEKRASDRALKAEEELISLRRDANDKAQSGMGEVRAQLDVLTAERNSLKAQVLQLEQQMADLSRQSLLPLSDDGMALPPQGLLEQVPYSRVLQKLLKERFTGRVALRTEKAKREIYLENGAPVAFTSSEPGERLGRVLVAHGCITEEQYLAAARAMVEMGTKLTEALLEMGAIDAQRLQAEQRQLTRDQILSGFSLTSGSYVLEPGKSAPEEAARFEFKMAELFLQAYRKHVPELEIKSVYSSLRDAYVCLKPEFVRFRPQLGLDADDERLLKMMGEAYTVEEAVEQSGLAEDRVARLLAALVHLGLVEQWRPGATEFEARLRAEKLRQAEETLALQQKMHEREEKMIQDFQRSLQKLEEVHTVVTALQNRSLPEVSGRELSPPAGAPASRLRRGPVALGEDKPREALRPVIKDASVESALDKLGAEPKAAKPAPAEPKEGIALGTVLPLEDSAPVEDGPGSDRYKEGLKHSAAGRLEEAETALREAVRLDAGRPAFLVALAKVLLSNTRYERSGTLPVVRSLVDRAVALAPNDAEVLALQTKVQGEMA